MDKTTSNNLRILAFEAAVVVGAGYAVGSLVNQERTPEFYAAAVIAVTSPAILPKNAYKGGKIA